MSKSKHGSKKDRKKRLEESRKSQSKLRILINKELKNMKTNPSIDIANTLSIKENK
jgi:hypothetical protein